MRQAPGTRIGYVRLRVTDLSRALSFYSGVLGFRESARDGGTVFLSATGLPPWHMALDESPGAPPRPLRSTGLFHAAVRFPDRGGLAGALRRLASSRWPLSGASDHGVSEALYLSDPDGLGLELYVDRPRAAWSRKAGGVAMVTEPLDLDSLLAAGDTGRDAGDGMPPGTDIGHVHLRVSDLGRSEAFYAALIGLFVTQRSYPGALFLAAGQYHHHLGVNVWAGKGLPAPPAGAVGLLSFSLLLPDAAGFEALTGRLAGAGVALLPPAGRAPPGAVLAMDPDGIGVELVPAVSPVIGR